MATQCDPAALLGLLQGEMSPEETLLLVRHVENCTDCRERLQVMAGLAALRQERRARGPWASYGKLGLLAAGLLVAMLLPLLWSERHQPGPAELATTRPYPVFPLQTRAGETQPSMREALAHYSNGAYAEAEALFARFPDDPEALFLRGVCLYFLDRFPEAVTTLEGAAEAGGEWKEPAAWYRANALLRQGASASAREAFEELARSSGSFSAEAEAVLRRLETAK